MLNFGILLLALLTYLKDKNKTVKPLFQL
ncbi:hypothetical protein NNC92_01285 [Streptococcus mutans]|nr:hypothetical protein [Streptococcus mutans]MDT9519366.1 hypothetical protein [Streptococcus mutans]MDT9530999.1 hypothetical protein [Streptococcus mutans]MDT9541153.1 hypothetical protein [Streptococcus mutans]MDT9560729.1 hypothetical protein [Streptococcus mutans]